MNYTGPECLNLGAAGDWCGVCSACTEALQWILTHVGEIGEAFRARPPVIQ